VKKLTTYFLRFTLRLVYPLSQVCCEGGGSAQALMYACTSVCIWSKNSLPVYRRRRWLGRGVPGGWAPCGWLFWSGAAPNTPAVR